MSNSGWQPVRTYPDHLGHGVVLEQFVEPDFPPDPSHLVPIQVYSLVCLDADHQRLREYLMHSFMNQESKPLFEIYSYCPPDAFACIEHNRREIAHRKQQHGSGVQNPPPVIPQFFRPGDDTPVGCCILLRSHSYRLGYVEDWDELAEAGEGPDVLYFNRSFSSTCSNVRNTLRSSGAGGLSPEAFVLSIERVMCQIDIGHIIMNDIFLNAARPGMRDAVEVDEGEPPDSSPLSEEQIRDQLDQETSVGGFGLDPSFQVSHDTDIVTVTNAPEGAAADIQYIAHVPFLSHLHHVAVLPLLESTARLFTASIASHLPTNKALTLKFSVPDSPSWSSIRSAQTRLLFHQSRGPDRENPFPVGALHTFSAGDEQAPTVHRITPQQPEDSLMAAQRTLRTPFRVFAVVLDRARFVSKAGAYFYMADWDALGDPDPDLEVCPDDTWVWRGLGMSEVAGRLGMTALEL